MHDKPKVLTPAEARQGSRKRVNLRVLVFSMLLAVVAGLILYTAFYNDELPGRGTAQLPPESQTNDPNN